jgi:hypothetical protein
MSSIGRLQDLLHDHLRGYEMGNGEQVPGPLATMPLEEWRQFSNQLEDALWAWHNT